MKRKVLSFMIMATMILGLFAPFITTNQTEIKAETIANESGINQQGNFGVDWTLYNDGELVLEEGVLNETNQTNRVNWYTYKNSITKIRFNGEVKTNENGNTWLFRDTVNLTEVINIENFKPSGDITRLFSECSSLETIDLSVMDTSEVVNFDGIFVNCTNLKTANLSGLVTSKVTDIHFMFNGCSSLETLDVSNWDTSNVTRIDSMFENCSSLTTLDVSNWDTSNVVNMAVMFRNCSSLTALDVSNWDTNNVETMYDMFERCSLKSITLGDKSIFNNSVILSEIDTSIEGYKYTGQWGGMNTGQLYSSSTNLMSNYDGTVPDTYVWEQNFSDITFDLNGGTGSSIPSQQVNKGDLIQEPIEPTKTGYEFNGWYANHLTTDWDFSKSPITDMELYAGWSAKSYTITYDKNDGIGSMSDNIAIYDQEYTFMKNEYTRDGYEFVGWSTTKDGEVEYVDEEVIPLWNIDSDTTFYAKWKEIKLEVNGLPNEIYVGDTFTLTPTTDTREKGEGWKYDEEYFDATFNSPATFTAKKVGTTTISYTSEGEQVKELEVTIKAKQPVDPTPEEPEVNEPKSLEKNKPISGTNTSGTSTTTGVKSGDTTSIGFLLGLSFMSLVIIMVGNQKRKENNKER